MSFHEASTSFTAAIQYVDSTKDPKTWNMLHGLIKLSESLNHLESDVQTLSSNVGCIASDVRNLKHR